MPVELPAPRAAQDAEDRVIDLAMEAATNAAALVIQQHLGVTEGDYAAEWWSAADVEFHGEMLGFARVLRDYYRSERQAQINDDGTESALRYALAALERDGGPIPEKAEQSRETLRAILAQRGCERWGAVPTNLQPDGTLHIKPEGQRRLVDLIDVIVRG